MCARYSWGAAILEFETAGVLLIRAPVARLSADVVLRVIYQMSEAQFKQYWVAKIFARGSGLAAENCLFERYAI